MFSALAGVKREDISGAAPRFYVLRARGGETYHNKPPDEWKNVLRARGDETKSSQLQSGVRMFSALAGVKRAPSDRMSARAKMFSALAGVKRSILTAALRWLDVLRARGGETPTAEPTAEPTGCSPRSRG